MVLEVDGYLQALVPQAIHWLWVLAGVPVHGTSARQHDVVCPIETSCALAKSLGFEALPSHDGRGTSEDQGACGKDGEVHGHHWQVQDNREETSVTRLYAEIYILNYSLYIINFTNQACNAIFSATAAHDKDGRSGSDLFRGVPKRLRSVCGAAPRGFRLSIHFKAPRLELGFKASIIYNRIRFPTLAWVPFWSPGVHFWSLGLLWDC